MIYFIRVDFTMDFTNHDWKFDRNVATTGGQAKSRAWTSDGVITYLMIRQCPRARFANISALRMIN